MEQLINTVNNPWFFATIASLFALYVVILSVVLAIWTARDIRARTTNGAMRIVAPALVLLFGFAGFVPYLVLRPRATFAERKAERQEVLLLAEAAKKFECPTCFAAVEPDFAHCPQCNADFKPLCQCGAALDQAWKRCAFCGVAVSATHKTASFARPIPAVDLPAAPAVIEAPRKGKIERVSAAQVTKLVSGRLSEQKGPTQEPTKQPKSGRGGLTRGLTGSLRRALAIKR